MTEKRLITFILALFIILGSLYAIVTPVFEASDELWHYPMVKHLADGNSLPVQVFDPVLAGPWKQEASQPPLYYYLGAALTFWIDTEDMEGVRWLNPHVDNGVITSDGNINLVVHDPQRNPWQGTSLAIRLIRLFSVLLGAVTVYLTYRIAREGEPDRPEISLGAAAVNAFLPMFLFISGAVNNDNLVIPLSSLALFMMIRLVRAEDEADAKGFVRLLVLGIVIGLGALTKISALGLLALAGLAVFLAQWGNYSHRAFGRGISQTIVSIMGRYLLVLIPALLVAGWWYARNIQLYGDWSGWNAFIAVLGQRAHLASLAQLWDERWGFMLSYWGLFGGLNVSMPAWIYYVLNSVLVIAVVGFVVYSAKMILSWRSSVGLSLSPFSRFIQDLLDFTTKNVALILCLLWSLAIVIGLVRWATITWSSQGRLVFTAISALSTLFVVGLVGWLKERPATIIIAILAIFMFAVALLAPLIWIQPAYKPKLDETAITISEVNKDFGGKLRLLGYELQTNELIPGEKFDLILVWEALDQMDRDWSVFVHVNDPILQAPIAQRDMYLGQGLVATSLLDAGDQIANRYQVAVPANAIAPSELSLTIGLYDYSNGERLRLEDGRDALEIDTVQLNGIAGDVPNSISINYENELELLGFNISSRRVAPDDTVDLSLFWRPLADVDVDYTFFAQVVDKDTTRWASHDIEQPTSDWLQDEIHEVKLLLPLDPDTPPGVYPVIIGVYTRSPNGEFDRLQTVTSEGRLTDDFFSLVEVRVDDGG